MLLYHFTSRDILPAVLRSGLSRGSVPVSPVRAINAVWLTTDGGDRSHGLSAGGRIMSEAERRQAADWTGVLPPEGSRFAKEASARITVEIAEADARLESWLPWARRHLSADTLAALHPVASGSMSAAKTWRLYFGVILPQQFRDVALLDESAVAGSRASR